MKIQDMDAFDMVTELRRCRAVAKRNSGRTDPNPIIHNGWKISAERHAARAAKLTEILKTSNDPELRHWLGFYKMEL